MHASSTIKAWKRPVRGPNCGVGQPTSPINEKSAESTQNPAKSRRCGLSADTLWHNCAGRGRDAAAFDRKLHAVGPTRARLRFADPATCIDRNELARYAVIRMPRDTLGACPSNDASTAAVPRPRDDADYSDRLLPTAVMINQAISWTRAREVYPLGQLGAVEPGPDEANAAAVRPPTHAGPELSIIAPTFNERENVAELAARLKHCLAGKSWEIIFVDDDSPDGTAEVVRELAEKDGRIRCIRRIGRRGLSSACVEGMLATSAPYIAVIDADLQHDERLLPQMLATLKQGDTDIVVGTRYAPGGDIEGWSAGRARMSRLAGRLSRGLVPEQLTDPMSGFFMMRRPVFDGAVRRLSAIGFKILIDLFASSPQALRFKELPYRFRPRHAGESKLDSVTVWDYVMLLLGKLLGDLIPVRFLAFSIVGTLGVAVHFAVLALLFKLLRISFIDGQAIATLCAMSCNYSINNVLTYRDQRLRGSRWLRGWISFIVACSVGGLMNLGVASVVYGLNRGWFLAAIAGILVGSVWNYAVTKSFTWGRSGT